MPRMPSEIYPEYFLIRVNEFNKVAVTPLEEWIEYLKTGREKKRGRFLPCVKNKPIQERELDGKR